MAPKATQKTKAKAEKAPAVPSARKVNAALSKPLTLSPALAVIVGQPTAARTEVVSKVWDYIRAHNLQNPENKREIIADDALRAVFGQDRATMFEMNGLLSKHLT